MRTQGSVLSFAQQPLLFLDKEGEEKKRATTSVVEAVNVLMAINDAR